MQVLLTIQIWSIIKKSKFEWLTMLQKIQDYSTPTHTY